MSSCYVHHTVAHLTSLLLSIRFCSMLHHKNLLVVRRWRGRSGMTSPFFISRRGKNMLSVPYQKYDREQWLLCYFLVVKLVDLWYLQKSCHYERRFRSYSDYSFHLESIIGTLSFYCSCFSGAFANSDVDWKWSEVYEVNVRYFQQPNIAERMGFNPSYLRYHYYY